MSPIDFERVAFGTRSKGGLIRNAEAAAYKKIRDVIFLNEIPLSGVGKVLKRELKEPLK